MIHSTAIPCFNPKQAKSTVFSSDIRQGQKLSTNFGGMNNSRSYDQPVKVVSNPHANPQGSQPKFNWGTDSAFKNVFGNGHKHQEVKKPSAIPMKSPQASCSLSDTTIANFQMMDSNMEMNSALTINNKFMTDHVMHNKAMILEQKWQPINDIKSKVQRLQTSFAWLKPKSGDQASNDKLKYGQKIFLQKNKYNLLKKNLQHSYIQGEKEEQDQKNKLLKNRFIDIATDQLKRLEIERSPSFKYNEAKKITKDLRKVSINQIAQRSLDEALPQAQQMQLVGRSQSVGAFFSFIHGQRKMESSNIFMLDSMTLLQGDQYGIPRHISDAGSNKMQYNLVQSKYYNTYTENYNIIKVPDACIEQLMLYPSSQNNLNYKNTTTMITAQYMPDHGNNNNNNLILHNNSNGVIVLIDQFFKRFTKGESRQEVFVTTDGLKLQTPQNSEGEQSPDKDLEHDLVKAEINYRSLEMSVDKDDQSVKSQQLISQFQKSYPCLFMDLDGNSQHMTSQEAKSSYIDENVEEWYYDQHNNRSLVKRRQPIVYELSDKQYSQIFDDEEDDPSTIKRDKNATELKSFAAATIEVKDQYFELNADEKVDKKSKEGQIEKQITAGTTEIAGKIPLVIKDYEAYQIKFNIY